MIDEIEFFRRIDTIVPGEILEENNFQAIKQEIYFERLSLSGLDEMHEYSKDERLYEFFEFDPFNSIQETRAYIEKLERRMAVNAEGRNAIYWFVRRASDDRLIGSASLVNLNYSRKSIEWGYGIDPKLWGGGYILKIQELLKRYVFEVLELNRLYGTTMVENHRTIASVLAAGMKHEGNLRDYYCKKGVFHDGWHYAMLRKEYFSEYSRYSANFFQYSQDDVIDVVSSVLKEEDVTSETSISNSFGWDSFNHMLIMIAIKEKMGITLSPAEVTLATSVKEITALITKKSSRNT